MVKILFQIFRQLICYNSCLTVQEWWTIWVTERSHNIHNLSNLVLHYKAPLIDLLPNVYAAKEYPGWIRISISCHCIKFHHGYLIPLPTRKGLHFAMGFIYTMYNWVLIMLVEIKGMRFSSFHSALFHIFDQVPVLIRFFS